jgi:hypothetical protein
MQVDRRVQRSEIKKKLLIDQQRLRASDESEIEELDNTKLMSTSVTRAAGMDVESSGSDSDGEKKSKAFVNPLAKKKTIDAAGELSEGSWSDDGSDNEGDRKKKSKDKKSKLAKKKKGDVDDEDVVQNFF